MSKDLVYIAKPEWFEQTRFANPIASMDEKLASCYPQFYSVDYDLRLLVTQRPSEQQGPLYNDYVDQYGEAWNQVREKIETMGNIKTVFLIGATQSVFEQLAPFLQNSTEILFLFKCPALYDLSALSEFQMLQCVHIENNRKLTKLWDVQKNQNLKALSFVDVSGLRQIDPLAVSSVEYVTFDSMDNHGRTKDVLFDWRSIQTMPKLKHLKLVFSNAKTDF